MVEERRHTGSPESEAADSSADDSEGRKSARERVSAGMNRGLEALASLRESLEETIHDARERGDLSADRARDMLKDVAERARDATADARERFDFVPRGEFEQLSARVSALEARLAERLGAGPRDSGDS